MDSSVIILESNLKLLHATQPALSQQLATMQEPEDISFCLTEQNEPNLKRLYEGHLYYYHSPISAAAEADAWFNALDLHVATTLFIYGIGLGHYYDAAKKWLHRHPHHALIFLEEDLAVLYRFLQTSKGAEILGDNQVQIMFLSDLSTTKLLLNELTWTYFDAPFLITALSLYLKENSKRFQEIENQIRLKFEWKKAVVHEYLNFGIAFYRNFYPNLLELPKAYLGSALFNRFPNVPAIICGAGPSLNKNIDLLPGLKDRALLFAGGSALNALIPKGILPHFGAGIDPNIAQYSRVAVAKHLSFPFFYNNRLYHEALKVVKGPRLYLNGVGGFSISSWFEEKLEIEGEMLDAGHNVVNFCIQIARALGCNPIILIGVDLAFTGRQCYAEGVTTSAKIGTEEVITHDPDDIPIIRQDIYGNPISTLWKWVIESEWISKFAEEHPHLQVINATEGGLGFNTVPTMSLAEVAEKYLVEPRPEINEIQGIINKNSLNHLTAETIIGLQRELEESISQCTRLCSHMIHELDLVEKIIMNGESPPSPLSTPAMARLEAEFESEIAYVYILEIFNSIFIHRYHRKMQEIHSLSPSLSKQDQALKQLALNKQRLVFLRDAALLNRELIEKTITDFQNL